MNNDSAQNRSVTIGQFKDITSALVQSVPAGMSFKRAQFVIQNKGALIRHMQSFFGTKQDLPKSLDKALKDSEAFTKKAFGIDVNLSQMFIFLDFMLESENILAIFIPAGMGTHKCLDAMNVVGVRSYDHVTDTPGSLKPRLYLMHLSENPENQYIDRSADSIRKVWLSGVEWVNSAIYAIAMGTYHLATSKYLDEKSITLFPTEEEGPKTLEAFWHEQTQCVTFGYRPSHEKLVNLGARMVTPAILL